MESHPIILVLYFTTFKTFVFHAKTLGDYLPLKKKKPLEKQTAFFSPLFTASLLKILGFIFLHQK